MPYSNKERMSETMKYDYIYSEAIDIITAKKDDGTKFFTKDTVCVAVTEDEKLYSAFNKTEYAEGKLITGSSEKEVIRKIAAGGNSRIAAMITMNCIDMVPVLPDSEEIEELLKLDKYNATTDVISPNNKYIKVKDLSEYDPNGDNSAIEILKVDITAKRSEKDKLLGFTPDFDKVTDEGETKSETKFLFAMPGRDKQEPAPGQPGPLPENQMPLQQGQAPFYTMDDVVHQYQPVDGRHKSGMNASLMSNQASMPMNRSQMMSGQYMQPGGAVSQQFPPNGQMMNQPYMQQQGMINGQYPQQGAPNGQMMNQPYMQQGMMNGQYVQQSAVNGQYSPNGQMVNQQYMGQGMMNGQYSGQMMNGGYMGQGMMNGQYGGQMMNQQYMGQGMMNGQYGGQMMNQQYMGQGMMNGQYGGQMMNGGYMGQGMMNGQYGGQMMNGSPYMQQQEEMDPKYLNQDMINGNNNNNNNNK